MNSLSSSGFLKYSFSVLVPIFLFSQTGTAQTNFDRTDSLANIANQFVIRFDVASGNIIMPFKKKIYKVRKNKDQFSLHAFQGKDSTPIILYREVFVNGVVKKEAYDTTISVKTPFIKEYLENDSNFVLFTKGKRMLKPKVGSFIRLIFENVPQQIDVFADMEFIDKNMEHATMAGGFLNSYGATLIKGVAEDSILLMGAITKKIDSTIKVADSSVKEQKEVVDSSIKSFEDSLENIACKLLDLARFLDGKDTKTVVSASEIVSLSDIFVKQLQDKLHSISDSSMDSTNKVEIKIMLKKFEDDTKNAAEVLISSKEVTKDLYNVVLDLMKQTKEFISNSEKFKKEMDIIHNLMKEEVKNLKERHRFVLDSVYNRRTVYMQPIQVQNSDLSIINITFRNGKKSETDIQREITLKNKFGFKMDFSTGFMGTGLVDSNYKILRAPNTGGDTSYIVPDSKGSFAVGFALLAHAYFRTGNRLNFAINTGLMLNGSNQTINYLTGISIPMGLEQRFIVSGGIAFGKVKRLVNYYTIDKIYPSNELNTSTNPITEKWDKNWYFGVSYNLSSLTGGKRNVVIAKP